MFRINSGVRQGCIKFPWLFKVYMDTVMEEMNMMMGKRGARFLEEGTEWRLPGLTYADNLVLCGKDLKVMVEHFLTI